MRVVRVGVCLVVEDEVRLVDDDLGRGLHVPVEGWGAATPEMRGPEDLEADGVDLRDEEGPADDLRFGLVGGHWRGGDAAGAAAGGEVEAGATGEHGDVELHAGGGGWHVGGGGDGG